MTKPFKLLRQGMSEEAQKRASEKTRKMLEEMPLQELRQARSLSQEQLAKILRIKQGSVSKIIMAGFLYGLDTTGSLKVTGLCLSLYADLVHQIKGL